MRLVLAVFVALAVVGCSGDDDDSSATTEPRDTTTTTTEPAAPTAAQLCAQAQPVAPAVLVAQPELTETSGIGSSVTNPGVVWAHNDSGGNPEVFAIGEDGADRGRYGVETAEAHDWEDMAIGPGPDDSADSLYLGDIGDNGSSRASVTIYRAAEPALPADPAAASGTITDVNTLTLTYADGARDAETLLADPVGGDLYVVSKEWGGGPTGAYRIPAESLGSGDPIVMERVADLPISPGQLVTGGDISRDGSLIAVRTYETLWLWERRPDQTVAEALATPPCQAPVATEPQGEAVAFAADGKGYLTVSEGVQPPLNRFALPAGEPPSG
jgi:hypothetical protein